MMSVSNKTPNKNKNVLSVLANKAVDTVILVGERPNTMYPKDVSDTANSTIYNMSARAATIPIAKIRERTSRIIRRGSRTGIPNKRTLESNCTKSEKINNEHIINKYLNVKY